MLKKAAEVIAQGDPGAVVDFAIDLNRRKVALEKELEEAKVYLREEARKSGKGAYAVDLEGLTGTATITFPGIQVRGKKGTDLRDLEVNLPSEVFAQLFRRTIEIIPALAADDFLEIFEGLSPTLKAKIKVFVEFLRQTPKVNLPK